MFADDDRYDDYDSKLYDDRDSREITDEPYDLSKIEPIAPVPKDSLKEVDNEFATLDTDLFDTAFVPNIAGTPPTNVTSNPFVTPFFRTRISSKKNGQHIRG